jgi:hypothetical protein
LTAHNRAEWTSEKPHVAAAIAKAGHSVDGDLISRRGCLEPFAWLSYAIVLSMIYFDAEPDDERLAEALNLARKGANSTIRMP